MEEVKHKEVELRSEEVQEVMGQIPPWILRYGISVLFLVLLVLLGGSYWFSYPETLRAEMVLTSFQSPVYVKTGAAGKLAEIYVQDKQPVRKGDILAVIDNVACVEDVFLLRERLNEWKQSGGKIEYTDRLVLRKMLELGNIQSTYSAFLSAWQNYISHMQEARLSEMDVFNAIASLMKAVSEWEATYLLVSPFDGIVSFMQPWDKKQPVSEGETLFVITFPGTPVPLARALLPMQSIGRVEVGQRAIIRLSGFSEEEYGILEGRISFISPVPNEEGQYVLELELPDGLRTSYGKTLPLIEAMQGTADIVIRERSLLERLVVH